MKRMLLILSCWLFLCPVLAEEETSVPAAMRFQAEQAVYCFYNAAIPENAFRQSSPAEDIAAADWYATLPSTGNTFISQWQTGSTFVCEIICGPGARLYDNCVTTIYYDAACDVITHVTFLCLD